MRDVRRYPSQFPLESSASEWVEPKTLMQNGDGHVVFSQQGLVRPTASQGNDMRFELISRQSGSQQSELALGSGLIEGRDDVGDARQCGDRFREECRTGRRAETILSQYSSLPTGAIGFRLVLCPAANVSDQTCRVRGLRKRAVAVVFTGIDLHLAMNKT